MINVFDCQSRGLLLIQLELPTLNKDAALQRAFRQVNKEESKSDSFLCNGSSQ